MRPSPLTKHPLRCSCNQKPLLAFYGRDANGKAYVHIRVYKQSRMFGEVYTTYPISLACRLCGRWWNINIKNEQLDMEERKTPEPLQP